MKKQILVSAGVIAGAAVGAAASLLLAPKKGSELRQDIASKAQDAKAKAQEVKTAAVEFKNRIAPARETAEVPQEAQQTEKAVAVKDEVTSQK